MTTTQLTTTLQNASVALPNGAIVRLDSTGTAVVAASNMYSGLAGIVQVQSDQVAPRTFFVGETQLWRSIPV